MSRHPWVAFLALLAGCGSPPPPSAAKLPPPTSPAADSFPVTVTDGLGRSVTVPRKPERIVCLAPGMTETLFAVGAGPRVVAVTTTDSYPPEVKKLPTVGGFSPKTISPEAVLLQRPDVVYAVGRFHQPVVEALEKLGLTVIAPEPRTLDEVADNIETVGRVTGCEPTAKEIAADFRRRLAAVRERAAKVPEKDRPKVLYILWDDPLQSAGPSTFVGRMIADAGGVNVLADIGQVYPRIGDEVVLSRDPDLVICPDHGAVGLPERLRGRPSWQGVTAVRRGRVRTVAEDLVNRPGPRLIDGLEAVENLVRNRPAP